MQEKYGYLINPALAFLLSLLLSGIIVALMGENPFAVYYTFFANSLFSIRGISYTLFYATPLIFTGLSVSLAFRSGLFNIGAEGQLYIGSITAAVIALEMPPGTPAYVMLPLCVMGAFLAGGIWGVIPGILKAYLGAHEVINTIMMNFIAVAISNYLVLIPYKRKNTMLLETDFLPESAHLPQFLEMSDTFSDFSQLNLAFILALLACVFMYVFIWKSKQGFEIRATGSGLRAALYAGINSKHKIVLTMFIAGGIAGLVAVHEVLGFRRYYHDNFSGGIGFIGIAVALMGRNHPVGILLAAILFGALTRGGLFMDINFDRISSDLVILLQGLLILLISSENIYRKSGVSIGKLFSRRKSKPSA